MGVGGRRRVRPSPCSTGRDGRVTVAVKAATWGTLFELFPATEPVVTTLSKFVVVDPDFTVHGAARAAHHPVRLVERGACRFEQERDAMIWFAAADHGDTPMLGFRNPSRRSCPPSDSRHPG